MIAETHSDQPTDNHAEAELGQWRDYFLPEGIVTGDGSAYGPKEAHEAAKAYSDLLQAKMLAREAELDAATQCLAEIRALLPKEWGETEIVKCVFDLMQSRAERMTMIADLENRLNALKLICGTSDAKKFETWCDRLREENRELRRLLSAAHHALIRLQSHSEWHEPVVSPNLMENIKAAIAATKETKT
jgi:hypothetical protein